VSSNGLRIRQGFDIYIKLPVRHYASMNQTKGNKMGAKTDELILKTAKEIVVKFIEVGNISPTSFHDHFRNIYNTIEKSVNESAAKPDPAVKSK
jgi:hypothetical protein